MKPLLLSIMITSLSLPLYSAENNQPFLTDHNPPVRQLSSPIQLITSGSEIAIQLQKVESKVEIIGDLAETTHIFTFYNPNNRQLEGSFEFPLEEGQSIKALALDIDGEMRDAVPVSKAKGQQVFEAIERRRVDPALLEQTAGHNFKLRIYPIPQNGTRTVKISYQEVLKATDQHRQYRLPLKFAHPVLSYQLQVSIQGNQYAPQSSQLKFKSQQQHHSAEFSTKAIQSLPEIEINIPTDQHARVYTQAFKDKHYFYADIPLSAAITPRQLPHKIGILWDASLSGQSRDIQRELALLDDYFEKVSDAQVELTLLRHRNEATRSFTIKNGDWSALKKALTRVEYDGASQLSQWVNNENTQEYLLFSDGIENFGQHQDIQLKPNQRLYSIHSNAPQSDALFLRKIAEKNQGQYISWHDSNSFKHAQQQLLQDPDRILQVSGKGIREVQIPSYFAQQGWVRVFGEYTPSATHPVEIQVRMKQGQQIKDLILTMKNTFPSQQIASLWAKEKVNELLQNPLDHTASILHLGQQFNLVTPNTSLIVLEDVNDYVEYEIEPPASLLAEYRKQMLNQKHQKNQLFESSLTDAVEAYQKHQQWWQKKWPKNAPPVAVHAINSQERNSQESNSEMAVSADAEMVVADAALSPAPVSRRAPSAQSRSHPSSSSSSSSSSSINIAIQPWQENAPYVKRLEQAKPRQAFAIYLEERAKNLNNPSFYLTVSDLFAQKNMHAEAIQVVSNLAELKLENRYILRLLGQQLITLKQYDDAIHVFKKVRILSEEEPQSWRDLALAYAKNQQYDEAIQTMYHVVTRSWDDRFGGIQLIAIDELNNFIAQAPNSPAIRQIDPRLIRNLPVGIRAVLTWDSDNSDMDLWITDPNNEKTYYSQSQSYQGGIISDDFTGGYGPEVFWLKEPKKGKYTIQAHFFGDQQQIVTGPTTAYVRLIRNWGQPNQAEEVLRIKMTKDRLNTGQDDAVLIGQFRVK